MSPTLALMRTELTLLRRDSTAWTTAIALPFLLGGLWAISDPPVGNGVAATVSLQVVGLLIFTLHTVGTMALAARREQLVLKRWRSSQARPATVLAGTIGVPAGLAIGQAGVLIAITAFLSGQRPASITMLAVALLAGVATVGAATFVVAAFTRSPEHAMLTTFPAVVLLLVAMFTTLARPFDPLDLPVLGLPGAAIIQLLRLAWQGPADPSGVTAWLTAAAPSITATIVFTAAATIAAVRWFQWDPRT